MVLCLLLQLSHLYYVALYKVSVLVCGLYQPTLQLNHAVGCYEDLNTTLATRILFRTMATTFGQIQEFSLEIEPIEPYTERVELYF